MCGIFSVDFDSTREIVATPGKEIKAKSVDDSNGDMKSVTRFVHSDGKTKVIYTAEWTPTSSVARNFGASTMKKQITKQFDAMQKEVVKRTKQGS